MEKEQILLQFRQLYKSDFGFQVLGNFYYVTPESIHEGQLDKVVTNIEEDNVSLQFSVEMERDSGIEFLLKLLEAFNGVKEGNNILKAIIAGTFPQEEHSALVNKLVDKRMDYLKILTDDYLPVMTLLEASVDDVIWIEDSEGYIVFIEASVDKDIVNGLVATIQTELFIDCQWVMGDIIKSNTAIHERSMWLRESVRFLEAYSIRDFVVSLEKLSPYQLINACPKGVKKQLIEQFTSHEAIHLDEELAATVEMLFEQELNLTDTARVLFIHRNTLLYRIDKIYKATGFDLRKFSDSFIFKLIWLLSNRQYD